MHRHLPARLIACAALAGSAFAAVAMPGSVASAGAPLTLSCKTLSGNTTTVSISGCTGSGAIAADAGTSPAHGTLTVSTSTIKWSNGKTSKITYKYGTVTPDKCAAKSGYKSSEIQEKTGTKVISGTALGLNGGAGSGKVCLYTSTAKPPKPATESNLGPVTL